MSIFFVWCDLSKDLLTLPYVYPLVSAPLVDKTVLSPIELPCQIG